MRDEDKTKEQLVDELAELGQRIASAGRRIVELETSQAGRKRGDNLIRAQRDLGLALATARGLDETLRLCLEAAIHVSEMDSGGIYLVDETSGACDIVSHQGLPPDFVKSASHFDGDSDQARLVTAGKPIYTEHLSLGVELSEAERRESLRALAVVPVRHKDRVVACLNVASHNRDEVPTHARDAIEAITAQIGSAIARTRAESQRDATLEALRESEQWLSTTLRSIGDAVIATDAEGVVTLMNPVAEDLTGWDEAEAVGKPLEDIFCIVNEQTGEWVESPVARVLREGGVVGLANHTVLIARDGTKRPIADSGAPMRDAAGKIIGTVMVFRDITERRRAEEELRQHRDHLEELVEQRTVELKGTNEELETEIAERVRAESQRDATLEALARRVEELERFNRLAVGRELRMIELKRQVNQLSEQLGMEAAYDLSILEG